MDNSQMRIIILTQNEYLYLPNAIGFVCDALREEIVCIVTAPAMSTHGGTLKGAIKNIRLFGVSGTMNMGIRIISARMKDKLARKGMNGPFNSIEGVAGAFSVPYHHVSKVNSQEFMSIVARHSPDLLISMSCPQVVGKGIRALFVKGCINVHGAPLPKYRGLMPAFWALRNGEKKTASTVHELAAKLDDGEIYLQKEVEITPADTWNSLVYKTKEVGAKALIEVVRRIRDGELSGSPNPEDQATYFSFPTAADRKVFKRLGRRFF